MGGKNLNIIAINSVCNKKNINNTNKQFVMTVP